MTGSIRDLSTTANGTALRAVASAVAVACGGMDRTPPLGELDWPRVADLVDRHDVGALVRRSGWASDHDAPPWLHEHLALHARQTAQAVLRCLEVQREVVRGLEAARVAFVVLKGPGLALEAHGDVAIRLSRDVDVLVAPDRVEAAVEALEAGGLRWHGLRWVDGVDSSDRARRALATADRLPLIKDTVFTLRDTFVELHWRLTSNRQLMPVTRTWLDAPRRLDLAGVSTPVLPSNLVWWHALVHGTTHEWSRLKWLADIVAMARRHPELVTVDALRRSGDAGLDRCAATGLLVGERVLGAFLDDDARAWAHAVPGTAPLLRGSLAAIAVHDPAGLGMVPPIRLPRFVASRLAIRGDLRYRGEEVRRMLLQAARAQPVADPGLRVLAGGPLRWLARHAQRRGGGERMS